MRAHHPRTPLTWTRGCCPKAGSPRGRSGGVWPRRWRPGGLRYDHAVQPGHLLWSKQRSLCFLPGARGHYAFSLSGHAVSSSVGLANCRIHLDIARAQSLSHCCLSSHVDCRLRQLRMRMDAARGGPRANRFAGSLT